MISEIDRNLTLIKPSKLYEHNISTSGLFQVLPNEITSLIFSKLTHYDKVILLLTGNVAIGHIVSDVCDKIELGASLEYHSYNHTIRTLQPVNELTNKSIFDDSIDDITIIKYMKHFNKRDLDIDDLCFITSILLKYIRPLSVHELSIFTTINSFLISIIGMVGGINLIKLFIDTGIQHSNVLESLSIVCPNIRYFEFINSSNDTPVSRSFMHGVRDSDLPYLCNYRLESLDIHNLVNGYYHSQNFEKLCEPCATYFDNITNSGIMSLCDMNLCQLKILSVSGQKITIDCLTNALFGITHDRTLPNLTELYIANLQTITRATSIDHEFINVIDQIRFMHLLEKNCPNLKVLDCTRTISTSAAMLFIPKKLTKLTISVCIDKMKSRIHGQYQMTMESIAIRMLSPHAVADLTQEQLIFVKDHIDEFTKIRTSFVKRLISQLPDIDSQIWNFCPLPNHTTSEPYMVHRKTSVNNWNYKLLPELATILIICDRCVNLEEITIYGEISKWGVVLLNKLKRLTTINFMPVVQVCGWKTICRRHHSLTQSSVSRLLSELPCLTHLNISGCIHQTFGAWRYHNFYCNEQHDVDVTKEDNHNEHDLDLLVALIKSKYPKMTVFIAPYVVRQ